MQKLFIQILAYIVIFIAGILTAYGKGWVEDYFNKKEENRKKIEDFMEEITNIVADTTASGYKDFPSGEIRSKMFRASAQLERLGETEMAKIVRNYMNKWTIYHKGIDEVSGKIKQFNILSEKHLIELKRELDELTNKILS